MLIRKNNMVNIGNVMNVCNLTFNKVPQGAVLGPYSFYLENSISEIYKLANGVLKLGQRK